ncbi:hypothetical protein F2Q70_00030307 [Brassica cretica]|uniref:Uncharacterized protein n=1 Tax=Brassica cretica TaxID=69181 RepID=A0A8S9FN36_BRACR|nr:hypothetical protein F2Q70_00030307 [Brassica cretica]
MMLLVLTPTNYGGRSDRSRPQRGEKCGSWPESKLVSSSLIEDVKIKDGGALNRGTPPEQAREDRDFTRIEKREKTASENRVFGQEREKHGDGIRVGVSWAQAHKVEIVGCRPKPKSKCMLHGMGLSPLSPVKAQKQEVRVYCC